MPDAPLDSKTAHALTAGLVAGGAVLVIISAPFAALADAPFAPGGWQSLPPHAAALHQALRPAFEFADAESVLRLWEAPLAVGFGLVASGAALLGGRALTADALTGALVVAATALLAAVALGTGLESLLGPNTPGGILYFIATPLAPLVACAAGVIAQRRRALPLISAWALTAAPLAVVASTVLLTQFPAGTGLGLALAWAVAVLAETSSRVPDQRGRTNAPGI